MNDLQIEARHEHRMAADDMPTACCATPAACWWMTPAKSMSRQTYGTFAGWSAIHRLAERQAVRGIKTDGCSMTPPLCG